ncbi:MAG: esterase family protein [Armatimonadetes bacterium CG_4_10_14_3_um_filter_66_18]|nr:esterase family protein [Armatimonadota bacterium]OIP06761.1 MAG: hypothetical protein AUJ96_08535 [Armatimonadetes bacterium CG2_30_66_41]PIU94928.1 MAG: esterase family protein [Armatimonadetes bacterium CG06_land_8_20_14_3_00_66_21]PIX40257.1 MAG: esterase family protein [Armatimonadetes bacterium CG_4_8_14_3_um_filter_66_20]PIY50175.1 MAG: esterase family protein [Armatimonadetes bacterium CG_4_10_14_3_um_filter_66_18]PIZ30209.1 MAG: esterase family protein [Armatimonadetes bacterium CG
MAFCEIKFRSSTLQKCMAMNVLLPQVETPRPYPVYYLLHGLSDDHTIWHRHTRIEWYVRELPLIVVMPDGGRSFYCDAVDGPAYETYLMEDLIGFVDRFFPTIAAREGRAIGGLSMGGYGAMKLALKFPDRFCSAVSHSGVLNLARSLPREDLRAELRQLFGDDPAGGKDDVFSLAENANPATLPALRIDCGVDDGLLQHNRDFHALLEQRGLPHEYAEFPGGHTWDYWDEHVQEALAFHCRALSFGQQGV